MSLIKRLERGVDTNQPPDATDRVMSEAAAEISRLRAALEEYACTSTDKPCGCYELLSKEKTEIARLTELANNLSDVVTRLNRENVELRAVLEEFSDTEPHQPPVPLWISIKARKALDK